MKVIVINWDLVEQLNSGEYPVDTRVAEREFDTVEEAQALIRERDKREG